MIKKFFFVVILTFAILIPLVASAETIILDDGSEAYEEPRRRNRTFVMKSGQIVMAFTPEIKGKGVMSVFFGSNLREARISIYWNACFRRYEPDPRAIKILLVNLNKKQRGEYNKVIAEWKVSQRKKKVFFLIEFISLTEKDKKRFKIGVDT